MGGSWTEVRSASVVISAELSSVFRVEEANPSTGVVTSFCCKRYRKILLLRRREYRPGPTGMGFITKLEDVKEEARILALLDHPRCLKLKEVLDSNPDSADGKVYFSQHPIVALPTLTTSCLPA